MLREMRTLLNWALDILAPLIRALPVGEESNAIFDPEGIVQCHHSFRKWAIRRRVGFDIDIESVRCAISLAQKECPLKEIESFFSSNKPVALLANENDCEDLIRSIDAVTYSREYEPNVVHGYFLGLIHLRKI